MKRILIAATVLCAAIISLTACNDSVDSVVYEGPEYILFRDTLQEFYVSTKHNEISVPVSSTTAVDYDRTFSVEVVAQNSSAIEDRHFRIPEHNLTIKAGQLAIDLRIETLADNFGKADSLGVVLRLVIPDNNKWELYGTDTKISLEKFCDLNMEAWFENERAELEPEKYDYANYIFYASFPLTPSADQFMQSLVKVRRDPSNDQQLIIENPLQKGRNLKIRMSEDKPGESFVTMLPQEAFFATNTLWVNMRTNLLYPSTFDSCKRFMELHLESYIDGYQPFGVYPYYLQWISQRRAEEIINNGF